MRVQAGMPGTRRKKPKPLVLEVPPIVRMLERVERWQAMLDSGEVRSRAEIGRREGLSGARVGQVLKLLDLPPDLRQAVHALCPGTPPRAVTERILRGTVRAGTCPTAGCPRHAFGIRLPSPSAT